MTTPGPQASLPSKAINWRQHLDLLVTYLRPQWPEVLLMTILLLASIGLELVGPQVLRAFIDSARSGGSLATLSGAALLFLSAMLGAQLISGLAGYFSEDVGWTATNRLRSDLALHCLTLDLSFHQNHTPGELMERVDGDVATLAEVFSQVVINVLGRGALLAGVLVLVAREDARIGLALAVYGALLIPILRRVQRLAIPVYKAARQVTAEMSGFWGEHLGGLEDLVSSGAAAYALRRYFALQRRLHRALVRTQLFFALSVSASMLLTTLGTALTLALSAFLFFQHSMTLGTVFLLYSYTALLTSNVLEINVQADSLQRARAGLERIAELSRTPLRLQDGPGVSFPEGPLALAFQDVSFRYAPDQPVLTRVSFQLAPGQVLGLLGHTGSGKTTITRLLFRFYDPDSGAVLLSGQNIRLARLADLRRRIGMVTQDVQVFQGTVRDNLTFFDASIPDARLIQAIETLGLGEWFARLPRGLDTTSGPDGGFSAGEAQLLAFCRVLLQDPQVIILDEASSRLDPATERLIAQATASLLANRTGLIIAHRLATVERVDRILILETGRVVEEGPRAALAADPGTRYARLLRTADREELLA
ncbi:MAG TPA: ABC transporter ATP-binding protein [Ktedonobacterales bacterium]|jgi:ATP-binding cassette subfamily B protein